MTKISLRIIYAHILILLLPLSGKTEDSTHYKITCNYSGLSNNSKVYLITQERDTISTTTSNYGKFEFTGKISLPGRFHFISFEPIVTKIISDAIFVDNTPIAIEGTIGTNKISIKGSLAQTDYYDLQNKIKEKKKETTSYWTQYNRIKLTLDSLKNSNGIHDTVQLHRELLETQEIINSLTKSTRAIPIAWLKSNSQSLIAPYILLLNIKNPETNSKELTDIYNSLHPNNKKSYYGTQALLKLNQQKNIISINSTSKLPDISILDRKGRSIRLYDIIKDNKYTLIDCWASWCKPCRAEIPNLLKAKSTFKQKGVVIIGISSDKNKDSWLNAIKVDQSSWEHYIENSTKQFLNSFDIQSIPAYLLVDQNGNIKAFDCSFSSIKNFGGSLRGDGLQATLNALP